MKPKELIIWLIIGISLLAMIVGFYVFSLSANSILKEEVYNNLESTAHARGVYISHYLEKEKDTIEASAKNWFFEEELINGIQEGELPILQKELEKLFDVSPNYIELFLLDKDGKVIASTNSEFIGLNKADEKYFTVAKEKGEGYIADVYEVKTEEEEGYLISSSVIERDGKGFLGVLVVKISLDTLNKITTDEVGLGETGEVYLINKDYYMITPSRFLKNTFLNQKIDTENARNCFEYSEGAAYPLRIGKYLNYRGIAVLGTNVYIPEKDWCLIVGIHEKEALGMQRDRLMKNALIIILILALILVVIGFVIKTKLDKIIRK